MVVEGPSSITEKSGQICAMRFFCSEESALSRFAVRVPYVWKCKGECHSPRGTRTDFEVRTSSCSQPSVFAPSYHG